MAPASASLCPRLPLLPSPSPPSPCTKTTHSGVETTKVLLCQSSNKQALSLPAATLRPPFCICNHFGRGGGGAHSTEFSIIIKHTPAAFALAKLVERGGLAAKGTHFLRRNARCHDKPDTLGTLLGNAQ